MISVITCLSLLYATPCYRLSPVGILSIFSASDILVLTYLHTVLSCIHLLWCSTEC